MKTIYTKALSISTALLLIIAGSAFAQDSPLLYTATVEVLSQNEESRIAAMHKGLAEVLVRTSGQTAVLKVPKIQQELKQADRWVERFTYEPVAIDGKATNKFMLTLNFNPEAVKRLLTESRQGLWLQTRPITIAWFAMDTPEGKQLIGNDSELPIPNVVQTTAEARGVPVILPLLDLTDLSKVNADDVWQQNAAALNDVGTGRYNAEAVLMGKFQGLDNGKKWHANWVLMVDEVKLAWEGDASTLSDLVKDGINTMTDKMGARFAQATATTTATTIASTSVTSPSVSLTLAINGIKGMGAYAKSTSYLENLPGVSNLAVQTIGPDYVVYELSVSGGSQELVSLLKRDAVLVPATSSTDAGVVLAKLNYQLSS